MATKTASVLAGDIGGTKTRLALFHKDGTRLECTGEHEYESREHESLDNIIADFRDRYKEQPAAACFGVAGPVRENAVDVTNLPWKISAPELERRFHLDKVALLNDLEATALGIASLPASDFHTLNRGMADPRGNAAIIAAGTGLGEAGLYHDGSRYRPFATEGGHTDFSPGNDTEIELLHYLLRQYEHVSWERLLSGPGLVQIHAYLCNARQQEIPVWLLEEQQDGDPAAAISSAARNDSDPVCRDAQRLFIRLYGREAGNLALKTMATGGLYLGGGIAPKILDELDAGDFMETFSAKGRMRPLLECIPVKVILNDHAALYGAASCAAGLAAST
ncbi:MAG: glucokinase [Gammaproteobacteria bacterium]|nr:MAG: glucokinase [Gammaproteobacteria bacterium]